jgi:hypothetical protein
MSTRHRVAVGMCPRPIPERWLLDAAGNARLLSQHPGGQEAPGWRCATWEETCAADGRLVGVARVDDVVHGDLNTSTCCNEAGCDNAANATRPSARMAVCCTKSLRWLCHEARASHRQPDPLFVWRQFRSGTGAESQAGLGARGTSSLLAIARGHRSHGASIEGS